MRDRNVETAAELAVTMLGRRRNVTVLVPSVARLTDFRSALLAGIDGYDGPGISILKANKWSIETDHGDVRMINFSQPSGASCLHCPVVIVVGAWLMTADERYDARAIAAPDADGFGPLFVEVG